MGESNLRPRRGAQYSQYPLSHSTLIILLNLYEISLRVTFFLSLALSTPLSLLGVMIDRLQ